MKNTLTCMALMLSVNIYAQSRDGLLQRIQQELAKQKGFFAIACKDLQNGDTLFWNAHESFHAASTMKTPVMIEVYRQAAEGRFSLQDSVLIKNEFSSIVDGSPFTLNAGDDSEQELYKRVGQKELLYKLVSEMIINSSNLATNLVIEKVTAASVMKTMRTVGANEIQVLRGVEDGKAFAKGLNNTVTANDLLLLFEKIARGELVNREACTDMIRILLDQRHNTLIPAQLPEGVKVAHKTGSITGVHHDSGIIFLPDGRKFVLVILSKGLENAEMATAAMARVARMIYDAVQSGTF